MPKCQSIVDRLSAYVDDRLPGSQSTDVSHHLRECLRCSRELHELQQLRVTMHSVPARKVPPHLTMNLRILASRERARNTRRGVLAFFAQNYEDKLQLWTRNLMRPLAIPFAGGLCAALLLFCMLVPNFSTRYQAGTDVPTGLYTGATLKSTMMFGFSSDEVVLDVDIDDQGRMVDYTVSSGHHWMDDPSLRRTIENNLLFARFTPATTFGQPMSSRVRISFRPRSWIDVKG